MPRARSASAIRGSSEGGNGARTGGGGAEGGGGGGGRAPRGLGGGAASAEERSRVLLPLLRWLLPGAPPEQLAALHGLLRKAGHVAEYATLALLWFRAFRRGRGLAPRASAWLPPPAPPSRGGLWARGRGP